MINHRLLGFDLPASVSGLSLGGREEPSSPPRLLRNNGVAVMIQVRVRT
jgi:hypothetical protein